MREWFRSFDAESRLAGDEIRLSVTARFTSTLSENNFAVWRKINRNKMWNGNGNNIDGDDDDDGGGGTTILSTSHGLLVHACVKWLNGHFRKFVSHRRSIKLLHSTVKWLNQRWNAIDRKKNGTKQNEIFVEARAYGTPWRTTAHHEADTLFARWQFVLAMHEFLSLIYFLLSPFIIESSRRFMHTIAFDALFHLFRVFSSPFLRFRVKTTYRLTVDVCAFHSQKIIHCRRSRRTIKYNKISWQHLAAFPRSPIES